MAILLHAGLLEFLYYWLDRALHHHFLYSRSSVIFEIPQVNGHKLKTMMCHVHYSSLDNIRADGLKNLLVINNTKTTIQLYKKDALVSFEDEEWQRVLSNIEPGNKVEIIVVFGKRLIVYKTIVYLIYAPMDQKMEHCPSSNKNVHVSSGDENACVVNGKLPQRGCFYKFIPQMVMFLNKFQHGSLLLRKMHATPKKPPAPLASLPRMRNVARSRHSHWRFGQQQE
ncbi:hypothetical protein HKD37_03G007132 [Glycine soja]